MKKHKMKYNMKKDSKENLILEKGYESFLKLRENAKYNGTIGMTLEEINEIIYNHNK